ncbi:Cullin repeat-like-containing domain protein [Fomitopsis serialis]|uniref:Cullin repeat-like-containing domain protein n=1 Tax=Fomitopsis serialis TaxID=139415 RepID=UPI002007696C|nr:Cullin repeat-like-containing domain protein [Neoantrodia serialis]KAH9932337.1 Cullin repeat-like-containing domain protein [Neoantrodia serialis]
MDDETAEIELLEQNLNKTRQISQRMTSILSSFDARLVKLEKSILPLYNSSQILTRRAKNIESALNKIDEIHAYQEGIAAEEALVLRGPQPGQLQAYIEIVTRMNQTIAFGSMDLGAGETARLVETGAKKLMQLYTKLVAEASSGTPINGPDFEPMPFPPDILGTLHSLVAFLRTLPLPPTHPTHPAAPAIQAALKEAQKGYGDMRGAWGKKCLEVYGKRVVERAGTIDGVATAREFAKYIDNIMSIADAEYALLLTLAPLTAPASINSTYTTLLNPLCSLFSSTLSSLSSLIKRDLTKNTPMALSLYSCLNAVQEQWEETMVRRAGRRENELKDGMQAMKATCQRSFPELLADIKLAAGSSRGELSTGIIDTTMSTVEYIERLPDVREPVCAMLLSLGDGNWKMGEGAQVAKTARQDIDENTILQHFTFDLVNMTLNTLQALANSNRRPAFGSIFLLNNVSYLITRLLTRPSSPTSPGLLSKPAQDILKSNFRTAKAAYFDSNFSPMLQTLTDDGNKSKSAIKEKFTRFFDLFDETTERHQLARVLHDDEEARAQVSEEAVKLVVPSLQKFIQKNLGKEFSKSEFTDIKMSAEEVEALIKSFYLDGMPPPAERETNNLLIQAGWSR